MPAPQPRNLVPRIRALDRRLAALNADVKRAAAAVATWRYVLELAPPAPHEAGTLAQQSLERARARLAAARAARRLLRAARTRALHQSPAGLKAETAPMVPTTFTFNLDSGGAFVTSPGGITFWPPAQNPLDSATPESA